MSYRCGVRAWCAVIALVVASCFSPTPATNVPCGAGGACPNGQTCNADDRCVPIGTEVDAPIGGEPDASVDAFVAAAPVFKAVATADGTATSTTIMSPPGTAAGDLLLAHVNDDGVIDSTTIATPQGWMRVAENDAVQDRFAVIVFARFATADSESFTFTFPDALNFIHLMAFSGVDPSNPIDAVATTSLNDASQPTAPSITTTQAHTLLVTLHTLDLSQDSFEPIAGMTELYDQFTGQLRVAAHAAEVAAPGATGDRISARSGTDPGPTINFSVALAPR